MKWTEAVKDMAEGKIRVCLRLQYRIKNGLLEYYNTFFCEWYRADIKQGMQEFEWTIPEPTYREISWKEAVDVDWRKVEYKVKYGVWVPTTDDFSGNSVQFMKETEFRVREDDE